MDFGDIGANLPVILLAIGLILLQFFLRRRRRPEATNQEVARSLLAEVRLNEALAETAHLRQKPRKFEVTSWQRTKNKLDFLDESLHGALSDAFMRIEDFNQQIETAKKQKSASYIISIDEGKIKDSLAKSRQGLEKWLLSSTGEKEPSPKYPGIFDDWLGRG